MGREKQRGVLVAQGSIGIPRRLGDSDITFCVWPGVGNYEAQSGVLSEFFKGSNGETYTGHLEWEEPLPPEQIAQLGPRRIIGIVEYPLTSSPSFDIGSRHRLARLANPGSDPNVAEIEARLGATAKNFLQTKGRRGTQV